MSGPVEIYSSHLRRTTQTAWSVSERLGIEPMLDERLRESPTARPSAGRGSDMTSPTPAVGDQLRHHERQSSKAWRKGSPRPSCWPGGSRCRSKPRLQRPVRQRQRVARGRLLPQQA
ncbi:histidine phosphatase family protein [Amycolatopsis sp. NPDC059657]|uniref:histidine phosphatase family protein n=1 Tax=Amycolatopsis sp. NPDC059657 TaxID=3346899 RepID=UPI00366E5AC2